MSDMMQIIEQGFCNKCTFWKLISTYNIEIPIIQRDYAQGRLSENVAAIRNELLENIYNALVYDNPLNFDYFSVLKTTNNKCIYTKPLNIKICYLKSKKVL